MNLNNIRTMNRGQVRIVSLVVTFAGLIAMSDFAQQAGAQSAPPSGTPFSPPAQPAAATVAQLVAVPNDGADSNWASVNNAYATAAALKAKGDKSGACAQIQAATTSLAKVKASHPHSQDMLSKATKAFCGT